MSVCVRVFVCLYVCTYIYDACAHVSVHVREKSHIIAHSQGLTNGLSDRDYRVPYFMYKINI